MKKFALGFTIQSEREFLKLSSEVQIRIKVKMEFFVRAANPLSFAKKLKNYTDIYRFRIGDYRVLVTPKDKNTLVILLILKIGHRRDVYE